MLRKEIIKRKNSGNIKDVITWRCHEVLRIEAFSDAVFAFSITLLIVSLEVPETFSQLIDTMKGFFAFAISFALFFQIWYDQFKYFRRFGLQDTYSTLLNAALIFVVLFYMYPLKFLFNLLIPGGTHKLPEGEVMITQPQVSSLMIIYGAGFIAVQIIFVLMYLHALKQKDILDLNEEEVFESRTQLYVNVILFFLGLGSIIFAFAVPPANAGGAGFFYILILPVLTIYHTARGKIARKKFK